MILPEDTRTWLMEGDPAIRFQTLRDLLDAPPADWQAEQQRTLTLETGWCARLLALQDEAGTWGGGIYGPKWTSTTYTLLTLIQLGLPRTCAAAQRGAHLVLDTMLGPTCDESFQRKLVACDRCVVGMILQIAVYFGIDDARIPAIVDNLLSERMPDGGWNCRRARRPGTHHSSFHTTFNVLDGLRATIEYLPGPRREEVIQAESTALKFMLQHRLYKSDRSGEIIEPRFTLLSFPPHWHYDVLRGLEYFARVNAPHDQRLQDAIDLLLQRQLQNGRWPLQHRHSGKVFFNIESLGAATASRCNTLRALRILRWWEHSEK